MTTLRRHRDLRQAVQAADRRCRDDRDVFGRVLARLRARFDRHAPGWFLVGGVACGAIAARMPLVALLGAGRFVLHAASLVRRLPIAALSRGRAMPPAGDAA
jgi:hypothetical protein